jgi:hypothetical protein
MRAPFAAAGGIYATTTVPLVAHGHAAPRRMDGCCGASPWKRLSVSRPSGTTEGSEPDFCHPPGQREEASKVCASGHPSRLPRRSIQPTCRSASAGSCRRSSLRAAL